MFIDEDENDVDENGEPIPIVKVQQPESSNGQREDNEESAGVKSAEEEVTNSDTNKEDKKFNKKKNKNKKNKTKGIANKTIIRSDSSSKMVKVSQMSPAANDMANASANSAAARTAPTKKVLKQRLFRKMKIKQQQQLLKKKKKQQKRTNKVKSTNVTSG